MSIHKSWKYTLAAGVVIATAAALYTPARQFHRFFLTKCAADGPAPETELAIVAQPVDLASYYASVRNAAAGMSLQQIGTTRFAERLWPIYLASPLRASSAAPVLVIAGVHGNEISGSLAAIKLLELLQDEPSSTAPVHVLLPANPVGLAHASRYNAIGCDINRDFDTFRTDEARAIRSAIAQVRPQLIIALHEGPQNGVFVIGTSITPKELLLQVTATLQARRIPLAIENNLGVSLTIPGVMSEGGFLTRAKRWLGIYTLGEHATSQRIPLLTTEIPWSWPSMDERIQAQVIATLAALRNHGPPQPLRDSPD